MFESGPAQMVLSGPIEQQSPLTELSMAYWFRPEVPAPNVYGIFSYGSWGGSGATWEAAMGDQAFLFLHNTDTPVVWSDPVVYPGNQWVHVASTWSASTGTGSLYVNGRPAGSAALGREALRGGLQFRYPDAKYGSKFFGVADDLAAWNATLTAAEVAAVYAGNTRVRAERMLVHWECDEPDAETVVDSSRSPASPWRLSTVVGGSVPKVPSSCPNVDVRSTVVAVQQTGPTTVQFPEQRRLVSAASSGSLSVTVGQSFQALTFTPAEAWATATFETSLGTVVLVRNTPPAPQGLSLEVPVGRDVVWSAAYWIATTTYHRDALYMSDAEGYPLSATVTALPALGQLLQMDGTPITAPNTAVTDPNLKVRYRSTQDAFLSVVSVSFAVSDEVSSTATATRINVTEPDVPPAAIPCSTTVQQDSATGVTVQLGLRMDCDGSSTIVVLDPPRNGRLLDADGRDVVMRPSVNLVEQWASEAVNASENESYYGGLHGEYTALMVVGPPDAFPSGGDTPLAWTPPGSALHWVHVRFADLVHVSAVAVYEVSYPNSVVRIDLLDADSGQWVTVHSAAPRTSHSPNVQTLENVPKLHAGFFPVLSREAKVYTKGFSPNDDEWPAIDAIKLVGYRPVTAARVPGRRVTYVPAKGFSGTDSFKFQADMAGPAEMRLLKRVAWYSTPAPAEVSITVTKS
eukprot:m51a1_g1590 hypothetical protein (688) ;mRNA; r:146251-148434